MSTKTKTKWRLGELPTPGEVTDLVRADILTKDEAREILISLETDEERDKKSLQGEIKFLRELVEKLSNNRRADIIKEITVIEKPYIKQPWFQPYYYYATSGGVASTGSNQLLSAVGTSTNAVYTASTGALNAAAPTSFSAIKTF